MARPDLAYRPLVLADPEPRANVVNLGPPRDPVIAEWLGQYATTAAGVNVTPDNARRCPEVDACIGLIEDTIATVPLEFYERVDADHREARPENPLAQLLERPNGWQTSAEFRQMLEGYRNTHGNAYARIVAGDRGPVALEPVHPSTMRPFLVPTASRIAYRWQPEAGGAAQTLLAGEVLHLRGGPPMRANLAQAESKVDRHREDIGLLQACAEYLARFFSNNATPKAFLKVPDELGDEATAALRERYERRHRGLENQHILGILDSGLDLKTIAMTNDESEVLGVHSMAVAKIGRIFGVPLHLIGETDKTTSWGTGIEQQSVGFVTYYMRPKYVAWEQALNRALMSPEMGRRFYFEFNMDGLLRGDFKSRMDGYAIMIQWGLASPNEIRRLMNLPPVQGGDDRWQPLNMAPASRIMEVLLKAAPAGGQRDQLDWITRALATLLPAGHAQFDGEPRHGH